MGTRGALIMGFFGSVFAAMTLYWQLGLSGAVLALPFLAFASIAAASGLVMRLPGRGITPSPATERAIAWSSAGEGVALFVAGNVVMNLHRPALLLPAVALVVGLHFLPIAFVARFRPYYFLAAALIVAATAGFALGGSGGGLIAGFAAAAALWIAAVLAVVRDRRAKRACRPAPAH